VIAATLRLARSPRHRLLLGAGVAATLLALLSTAPAGLAPAAARAALAVAVLAAAPALLRSRARTAAPGPPSLRVIAREPLGRDAGVAIVEADGRRLLVGFGPQGVRALAAPAPDEVRP
jgi:flagellar protein FliO/FliZ